MCFAGSVHSYFRENVIEILTEVTRLVEENIWSTPSYSALKLDLTKIVTLFQKNLGTHFGTSSSLTSCKGILGNFNLMTKFFGFSFIYSASKP